MCRDIFTCALQHPYLHDTIQYRCSNCLPCLASRIGPQIFLLLFQILPASNMSSFLFISQNRKWYNLWLSSLVTCISLYASIVVRLRVKYIQTKTSLAFQCQVFRSDNTARESSSQNYSRAVCRMPQRRRTLWKNSYVFGG